MNLIDLSEWAARLSRFQTLIGAVLGFGGVVATLLWNAYQARRLDALRSREERLALLSAFYAELASIQGIVAQFNVYVARKSAAFSKGDDLAEPHVLLPCPRLVYEKNVDKLGRLGKSISFETVKTYSDVAEMELMATALRDASLGQHPSWNIAAANSAEMARYTEKALESTVCTIDMIKIALSEEKAG